LEKQPPQLQSSQNVLLGHEMHVLEQFKMLSPSIGGYNDSFHCGLSDLSFV
jgi:hypothetical protein